MKLETSETSAIESRYAFELLELFLLVVLSIVWLSSCVYQESPGNKTWQKEREMSVMVI